MNFHSKHAIFKWLTLTYEMELNHREQIYSAEGEKNLILDKILTQSRAVKQ